MQYTPSSGDIIAPGSVGVTELGSRVGGFIAGCGQAALLVALHALQGTPTSPDEVTALINSSVSQHLTVGGKAASGQATPNTLKTLASQQGVTLTDADPYQAINQYAGSQDIVVGVNNASAFGGSDAGVGGHYITIVGRTSNGNLIVSDPNTPESQQGQFVTYSIQQLRNANPFWAGVAYRSGSTGGGTGGGSFFDSLGALTNIAGSLGQINNTLGGVGSVFTKLWGGIGPWVSDPIRIVKLVVGVMLIQSSIGIAIGAGVGGPVLSAMGLPDVGQAVGALGKRRGAGRTLADAATARGQTVIEKRTQAERERGQRAERAERERGQRAERAERARGEVQSRNALVAGLSQGIAQQMETEREKRRAARAKGEPQRKATVAAKKAAQQTQQAPPTPRQPARTAQRYFGQFGRATKRGAQQRQRAANEEAARRAQSRDILRQRAEQGRRDLDEM